MADWRIESGCYRASYPVEFPPKAYFVYRANQNMTGRDILPCVQNCIGSLNEVSSNDVIVIGDEANSNYVLAGALTAFRSETIFRAIRRGNHFTEIQVEQPSIKPGEEPEEIMILKGSNWQEMLFQYADAAAAKCGVPKIAAEKNLTGYCTWYYYYKDVTGQDLLDNIKALAENRSVYAGEYLQIDDGYQSLQGDWLERDKDWPFTLESAAAKIIENGMKPGIWLMPFVASTASNVYKQHKDWFVKDAITGEPVIQQGWTPPPDHEWCCLDATVPAVREHIANVFKAFNKMGYVYFKLDGLGFGLVDGVRQDANATPVSAYRLLLKAIREAVPDCMILACSEPFLPSLGYFDNARASCDTSRYFTTGPKNMNTDSIGCNIKHAAMDTLSNFWKIDRWYRMDPDSLMARQNNAFYTFGEARISVLTGIITGVCLTSDKLDVIAPERLRLLGLAQDVRMRNAKPFKICVNQWPMFYEGTVDGKRAVAVLNYSEEPLECVFKELDLPQNCHEIFADAIYKNGATIPPHDAALFVVGD